MIANSSFLANLWEIFLHGGAYMLLGFGLAGIVQTVFSRYNLARFFGGSTAVQSLKGVLVGAPLPVCSCGVVPVSLALSRSGVPRPALMSFLISTPETGLASVLISLALLGPLFTWLRPLTASVTALLAGVLIAFWDRGRKPDWPSSTEAVEQVGIPVTNSYKSWIGFLLLSIKNGFVDILDDVAFWLVVGIVLSAVVTTVVPPNSLLGLSPWWALVLALIAGLPLYMCAVASTPVAMALLAKGLAPGAVLVFLLVGPATNIGTLSLLLKFYGKRFVLMYVAVVSACALAAGAIINLLGVQVSLTHGTDSLALGSYSWISYVFGIALAMMLLVSLLRTGLRSGLVELFEHLDSLTLGYATPMAVSFLEALKSFGAWFVKEPFKRLAVMVSLAVTIAFLLSSFVLVGPGQEGFIFRFGRIADGPLDGGIHAKWPWPVESSVIVPTTRLQEIRVGFHIGSNGASQSSAVGSLDMQHKNATVLTSEELLVEVPFSVRYRIKDARRYYFELSDAKGLLQSLAEEAVRESARAEGFNGIVSIGRDEFAADCEKRLETLLEDEDLGVDLLGVLLVDSHPHADTAEAFRSVSDALEDRATRIEVSRAKRIKMLASAKGEGARLISKAKQDASRTMAEARGRSLAFAGLRAAYRSNPGITRMRLRLEAAQRALADSVKWILPSSNHDVNLWFGLNAWALGRGGK